MKVQKQSSGSGYFKYVVVVPKKLVKKFGLKHGDTIRYLKP